MQDPLIDIAISANAGSYTMPVVDVDYPFGLRGAPVDEAGLKRALAMPLVVLLGTADNDPHHPSLPDQPEAMAQGPYRLRSEEHTSELQSLMRTSYAAFRLKTQKNTINQHRTSVTNTQQTKNKKDTNLKSER